MTRIAWSLPDGLSLVKAGPSDNEAVLEFMRGQSMQAGVSLRFDRSPDYFALHAAHSPDHETWLLRNGDEVLGLGSFVQRLAWVDGRMEPVIYMADLRAVRRRKVAGLWRPLMREVLCSIHARTGAELAYCSILRDNKAGRHALLRTGPADTTPFVHLHGYSNVSIVARKPWAHSTGSLRRAHAVVVRRADNDDAVRLRQFIDAQSRETQFGAVFDDSFWSRRLEQWPDFALERFYLACDAAGEIVGCLAPWDSVAINRIVIERLPASADLVRLACNALTPLSGRPRVRTGPDNHLPDIALTHVFIRDRAPHVLAALLRAVQRDIFRARRHALISLCMYDDDPMRPALDDYWSVAVPMDLFWLDVAGLAGSARRSSPGSGRFPGFESYLV